MWASTIDAATHHLLQFDAPDQFAIRMIDQSGIEFHGSQVRFPGHRPALLAESIALPYRDPYQPGLQPLQILQ